LLRGHHTSLNPKLQKRFYKAVILLNVLSKSQGDHIDEDPLNLAAEPSDLVNSCEIRRNFLKQLAYICDSEKGGDTTAAIAAEQTPQGLVLWIASNKCSAAEQLSGDIKQPYTLVTALLLPK